MTRCANCNRPVSPDRMCCDDCWQRAIDEARARRAAEAADAPVHCGRRMALRINRATGRGFYACCNRECGYTEAAKVSEPDWFGRKAGAK